MKSEDGTWNLNVYHSLTNSNKERKGIKQKLVDLHTIEKIPYPENSHKKIELSTASSLNLNSQLPLGLIWNENDCSCAYDSLFTVLYHIWNKGQSKHKAYFENRKQHFQTLHSKFMSLSKKTCTFESVCDHLRAILHRKKPLQYCYGKNYTDIDGLVRDLTS
jgi:hypothetical protein